MTRNDEGDAHRASLTPGHPLFGIGYSGPFRERPFSRLVGDATLEESAMIAEEVPVALIYDGRPHLVMMATPADLEDFAVGFTLSEEIVGHLDDIQRLEVIRHAQGIELQLEIGEAAAGRLAQRGRQLVGRTGCGLCGVQTIDEALRVPRAVASTLRIKPDALWRAEAAIAERQLFNQATGAIHAAAWADPDGTLRVVREDVGRHNALDKVLGALARDRHNAAEGFLVMTSRASYELVQKAAVAGVPLLATISRPTDLAIRLAEATGITLVGLLRGATANVYAHGERLDHGARV